MWAALPSLEQLRVSAADLSEKSSNALKRVATAAFGSRSAPDARGKASGRVTGGATSKNTTPHLKQMCAHQFHAPAAKSEVRTRGRTL